MESLCQLKLKLEVEDSPNSAGSAIDAIRCAKLAKDRNIGGPLISISAYTMKHPPQQFPDHVARQMVLEFYRREKREIDGRRKINGTFRETKKRYLHIYS